MKKYQPTVSVIITTKNEAAVIESLLKSIANQTYKHFEIILVDNNSNDATVSIAKKYTPLVFNHGPERSAQRNFGAKKSSGEIVVFLDADMQLSPKVIESCIGKLEDEKKVAVIIPERSIGRGFWSKCKALEREFYLGVDWIERARCFRKKVFDELKGYDESMSGPEDYDFPQRVAATYGKAAIMRSSEFIIHNEGNLQFWELIRRKYYYGRSMKQYITKSANKKDAFQQANIFARYLLFLKNPIKLLHHPIISMGMIILKTSEICALGLGTIKGR